MKFKIIHWVYPSETTKPRTNTVALETFPSSAFKSLTWIFTTTTKISNDHVSMKIQIFTSKMFLFDNLFMITSFYFFLCKFSMKIEIFSFFGVFKSKKMKKKKKEWHISLFQKRIKCHPFSGLIHSAGALLHVPKRIPTSMATFQLSKWINTFPH